MKTAIGRTRRRRGSKRDVVTRRNGRPVLGDRRDRGTFRPKRRARIIPDWRHFAAAKGWDTRQRREFDKLVADLDVALRKHWFYGDGVVVLRRLSAWVYRRMGWEE